jgi:hypothetical protein
MDLDPIYVVINHEIVALLGLVFVLTKMWLHIP